MQTIIIGPPGTGKTTRLLEILEDELHNVNPNQIAFVSFTRKGAYEAKDRAIDIFGFDPEDLPYFRTLHSIAFREHPATILTRTHYRELGELLGLKFTGYMSQEEITGNRDSGDRYLFMMEYARNTCQSLERIWHQFGEVSWPRLKQISDTLDVYKNKRILKDFTDLIEEFEGPLPVKVAIIDEAQDLSTLQWRMIDKAFSEVDRIYIAGDDDQAIYKWSGADIKKFLSLKGNMEFLKQSHRLPKTIFDLSQTITKRITNRYDKSFSPKNEEGTVKYHRSPDHIKLDHSSWLLLARNRYMLKKYKKLAELQGMSYSTRSGNSVDPKECDAIYAWERHRQGKPTDLKKALKYTNGQNDLPWFEAFVKIPLLKRIYYRTILQRGGNLAEKPKIHIDSIHGVKGGEADNVALMSDMSFKTYSNYRTIAGEDDEHRVFYVGVTRAKKNLHIILPTTTRSYRMY